MKRMFVILMVLVAMVASCSSVSAQCAAAGIGYQQSAAVYQAPAFQAPAYQAVPVPTFLYLVPSPPTVQLNVQSYAAPVIPGAAVVRQQTVIRQAAPVIHASPQAPAQRVRQLNIQRTRIR
jgi:hypothetical protein